MVSYSLQMQETFAESLSLPRDIDIFIAILQICSSYNIVFTTTAYKFIVSNIHSRYQCCELLVQYCTQSSTRGFCTQSVALMCLSFPATNSAESILLLHALDHGTCYGVLYYRSYIIILHVYVLLRLHKWSGIVLRCG